MTSIRSLAISQRRLGTRRSCSSTTPTAGCRKSPTTASVKSSAGHGMAPSFAIESFTDVDTDVRQSIERVRHSVFLLAPRPRAAASSTTWTRIGCGRSRRSRDPAPFGGEGGGGRGGFLRTPIWVFGGSAWLRPRLGTASAQHRFRRLVPSQTPDLASRSVRGRTYRPSSDFECEGETAMAATNDEKAAKAPRGRPSGRADRHRAPVRHRLGHEDGRRGRPREGETRSRRARCRSTSRSASAACLAAA